MMRCGQEMTTPSCGVGDWLRRKKRGLTRLRPHWVQGRVSHFRLETGHAFLAHVGARLTPETVEKLECALSEPLAETGFQRLKDDVGAVTLESVLLAAKKVSFVDELDLPFGRPHRKVCS